jgi:hypothetical protein
MGGLLILAIVAVLLLANGAAVRLVRRRAEARRWWWAFAVAWLVGAASGVWSGFFLEYQPKPGLRVFGAPFPGGILKWEGPPGEERWVDYVTPFPLLVAGSNIAILGLLAGLPVVLAFFVVGISHRLRSAT